MSFEDDLELSGFEVCEFEPSEDSPCEKCSKPDLKLYYRRTDWFVDEGVYCCADCVKLEAAQIRECQQSTQKLVRRD